MGNCISQLESDICRRFDVAAAVCVPMARTGLYLALKELIQPGQRVVMSPLTIIDVVNMVLLAGGIPVFADVLKSSCAIDPDEAESLIDNRTGAILITHLHGETAGAYIFREISRRRGVPLIEDAAQAFGGEENERRLGAIGDVGIYSFGFYKNLSTWQGGMLVSQNPAIIARIRERISPWRTLSSLQLLMLSLRGLMTDIATSPPVFAMFLHPVVRYCCLHNIKQVNRRLDPEDRARRILRMPARYLHRMSDAQAEIALHNIGSLDDDMAMRVAHAVLYHDALAGMEGLITPRKHTGRSHIYSYYPIQCSHRDALLRYAQQRRRDFAAQHLRNCADLPEFREFHRDCPNARAVARELILLPTYPRYPETEIRRNIEVIQAFLRTWKR
ncbi:MAG: DegT/DnrJ/EryC1/StrS family aminotransferase [Acidobacteriia bacterium]|nr:DegT/DnrJ/EryC1/StrS family aminotransferase [Terriglobia bacterium]